MNVLVYVLDALRADHLSCYGYDRETTPVIDEIAADGVRYSQCFSPGTWTKPVGASILTGLYPPAHGVRTREDVFNRSLPTLAAQLTDAGHHTVAFSTMGNVSASLGFDKGFDEYHDLYKDPEIVAKRQKRSVEEEELDHENTTEVALPRAEDLSERVCEWLDQSADFNHPFFAFCWSIEPHIPYNPPEEYQTYIDPNYDGPVDGSRECLPTVSTEEDLQQLKGLYDGGIRYNDSELGRIVSELKERGLYEDTLIVVLGDHGDAFNEHGKLSHGHLPHDELIHVPLIMKTPNEEGSAGDEITEMASLVDLPQTVLSAVPEADPFENAHGRVLPPFGPEGSSAPVYSEKRARDIYPAYYGIRTESWKYMEIDSPSRSPRTIFRTIKQLWKQGIVGDILSHPGYYLERYIHSKDQFLFDLEQDPAEKTNCVRGQSQVAASMRETLEELRNLEIETAVEKSSDEDGEIDSGTHEQLRQLGYVD